MSEETIELTSSMVRKMVKDSNYEDRYTFTSKRLDEIVYLDSAIIQTIEEKSQRNEELILESNKEDEINLITSMEKIREDDGIL